MLRFSHFVIALLIGLFLWLLRPQTLGGPAAYVTVDQGGLGSSLQPGDVAVVRHASSYKVGDLVAVQTSDGPAKFGRVINRVDAIYQVRFQADGDPVNVGQQYIIGKLWFNVGKLGRGLSGSVLNYFGLKDNSAP